MSKKATKKSVAKPAKKVTKMAAARAMYNRTKTPTRAKLLPKFITELKMTKAQAATYFQSIHSQA